MMAAPFDFRHWTPTQWLLAILAAVAVYSIVVMLPDGIVAWATHPTSDVPSSFDGRRWLYGLALWALMSISSLSMAVLVDNIRCITRSPRREWRHPLTVAIVIESLLMLTIVMGFGPDTVFLLVYGEQTITGQELMLSIDRFFDLLCALPFFAFFLIRTRGLPVIMFQLTKEPIPADLWPTWLMVRERLFMLALALVISMGVAVGK